MQNKKDSEISFTSQESKNIVIFRLFEKDNRFLFLYKKSERIVSAFYLVSNLLSDSEPMKWQIRNIGISIISHALSLTANPLSKSEAIQQFTTDLVKLLSLLDISYVAGFVSEMNFTLLKKELEHLLETLNLDESSQLSQVSRTRLFDKEFFAIPTEQLNPASYLDHSKVTPLSSISFPGGDLDRPGDVVDLWSNASRVLDGVDKRHHKGQKSIKDNTQSVLYDKSLKSTVTFMDGTARQAKIIQLLKAKSPLTMKDFSLIIKECSEKTIQRELLKLVQLGVLKKEGERRWSRYFLVVA